MARRRTPKVSKQYETIGGSPIRKWTDLQGRGMVKTLDRLSEATAPHKHYIAFRYADPLTEEALLQMKADGVTRAVAFSQYPHFSCTTTGSSLNHLWRELRRLGLSDQFQWSVIDRWPVQETYLQAVVKQIELGLKLFPSPEAAKSAVIVFSAHSLPLKVVNRGDQYPQEIAGTVQHVMTRISYSHPYTLAWQSQVGPLPWLGPQTRDVLERLGKQGHKNVLVVPIGFTSDHIETLFELDVEYGHLAKKAGVINYKRAPSLNDQPRLIAAQAELVAAHLASHDLCSRQYSFNCPACENPTCRSIVNPIKPFINKRDEVRAQNP